MSKKLVLVVLLETFILLGVFYFIFVKGGKTSSLNNDSNSSNILNNTVTVDEEKDDIDEVEGEEFIKNENPSIYTRHCLEEVCITINAIDSISDVLGINGYFENNSGENNLKYVKLIFKGHNQDSKIGLVADFTNGNKQDEIIYQTDNNDILDAYDYDIEFISPEEYENYYVNQN